MLDVGVAEILGLFGGGGVSIAARATTIGDDEGGLVLGKVGGEFVTGGVEVDGGRHVAGFPGVTAVDVDDGNFFVINGFLEIGDADIGEFTGEDVGGEEEAEDQGEQFFHGLMEFGLFGLGSGSIRDLFSTRKTVLK